MINAFAISARPGLKRAGLKVLGLAFLILAAFAAGYLANEKPRPLIWAQPVALAGASNFHQVSPGLYRSAQPTAEVFRKYEKLGIKTVICLNNNQPGDRRLLEGVDLNLVEIFMNPGNTDPAKVLEVMKTIRNSPGPVLVHCHRGADRTGLAAAVYRVVFENWDREAAIDEMINGGFGFNEKYTNIPEFIRTFDPEEMKAELGLGH